jgi:integrase
MADVKARNRGHGEDSIYFDAAKNRYVGAISLVFGGEGARVRRKVTGKTKQEVRDKLRALHAELDAGLKAPASYAVQQALDDWFGEGLSGCSAMTIKLYRDGVAPLASKLGGKQLRTLSATDVRSAMGALSDRLSTRSLQIAHNCLVRAIRHAEAADLVGRNVAELVRPPAGRQGRVSKALSLEEARALIAAAAGLSRASGRQGAALPGRHYNLYAYVVLLLTTGMNPEEARALRWDHVDLDAETVAV